MTATVAPELMRSIEANGQQQPALVRPTKTKDFYEIVLGRRRHRACELLGDREILCVVEDLDDDHALALMLSEQATKEDPDPILEAEAVAALLARPGWTLKAAAWAAIVWPRLQITQGLRHFGGEVDLEEAEWLAELLGLDTKKIEADAIAEIPDPKWWGTAAATPAPAKKGAKAPAAAADRRRASAGDDEDEEGDAGGEGEIEPAPKARKGGKRSS